MELGELQKGIYEIEKLNAAVIAISTRGDQPDVESTKSSLGITYILIPKPNRKIVEDFGLSYGPTGAAYATVILDKKGVIRFKDVGSYPMPEWASISRIITELQGI
jgi:peroxiredoxin